jgi:YtcA family
MRCATPGPHTPRPPSSAATTESARLQKAPARRCEAALSLLMCALLTACSGSPSVGILGAYFPDWLFCVIGGTVLTAVVHVLSYRHGYGSWLTPPAIVYPALTVLFSIVLWAVGFNL